jgi:erythromycin esterase-like protein
METGFSHGFGASAANRDLVRWMRAYNDNRPAPEQVHFAGFDGPLEITEAASPRQALTELHAAVDPDLVPCNGETLDRLLGPDDRWTNPAAIMDPSQSVGATSEAEQLRLIADDLTALLEAQTHQPDHVRLCARTATGLLQYHRWMADPSPARMPRLLGQRASMMAANLLALAERGPILAFAHNAHFQRDKSSMRLGGELWHWWSAGAIVSAKLGKDYAVMATALGTIRHRGVDAPPPDTIEGFLYALPADHFLVDPEQLTTLPGDVTPARRESPWFGYAPLDPSHLSNIDAIAFVKDAETR